jgi:tyrosyl-tRNA synthetase
MTLSESLQARGFIQQTTTDSIAHLLDGAPRTVYHGIDPSADSAHAGNFVNWMLLRHLAKAGHRVIFLVGGGTGLIGDPKPDSERPLASPEEVALRVQRLETQAQRLLGGSVEFVNNIEWLGGLSLLTFLRDIGKHFTVGELLKKEAIASRLASDTGLSYTEFAYPLLQAYDFLTLFRTHGVTVQVGGSDQWGNMVAGVELIRRLERAEADVLTVPLVIDKTTGKKFGKSEGNAVWLDPEKTTPYAFYQFWLQTADENVEDYLRLFTDLSLEVIEKIIVEHRAAPQTRVAQLQLAQAVTSLVHGGAITAAVERVSQLLFGEVRLDSLDTNDQSLLTQYAPYITGSADTLVVDVVVDSGLAASKREARTFMESGAVACNGVVIQDVTARLGGEAGSFVHIRRGKRQVALVLVK